MHEIRATVPPALTEAAARLAHEAGIEQVSIAEVFIHGPGLARQIVSADTSTPKARAFVDALLNSPAFSGIDYTLTSREVRSIVCNESPDGLTRPISEPFTDLIQDLWQMSTSRSVMWAGRRPAASCSRPDSSTTTRLP